jgi:hypothetical protein
LDRHSAGSSRDQHSRHNFVFFVGAAGDNFQGIVGQRSPSMAVREPKS